MLAGGKTVRVDDLFYRFSLDAATEFLFGKSVDSLENKQTRFADAFAEVQRIQALIARVSVQAPSLRPCARRFRVEANF